ncbi:LamG-like jellyroll fold domain-containing protein [Aeoliella sp.]|uniref:LamG-like jellyroll fold domain-containing protein n=1 Tax=Aeoliella sp. TaxID=2795800 RepID=UPI003CCB8E86
MKLFAGYRCVASLLALLWMTSLAGAQPIAWYNLDGNALDASGNGNHGLVTGTLAFDAGVGGSQALNVDTSVTNFMDAAASTNPGFIPRATIGAWVQADSVSQFAAILSGNSGSSQDLDPGLFIDTTTPPVGANYAARQGRNQLNPAELILLQGDAAVASSDFVFVAAVYDNSAQTVRLHTGANVVSGNTLFTSTALDTTRLGSNPSLASSNQAFDGSIDNVFFFNDALTDDEVQSIRTGGFAAAQNVGVQPGEVWGLDFESNSGLAFTNPGMGNGDVWNAVAPQNFSSGGPVSNNLVVENLLDSTGAATTVDFRITGDAGTGNNDGQGGVAGFVQNGLQQTTFFADWMLWNIPDVPDRIIEWEFTGLIPGAEYDFSAGGALSPDFMRVFDMLVDTDADGDFGDETSQEVASSPSPGAFFASVFADENGVIKGQAVGRAGVEANWTASQLRLVSVPILAGDYNNDGVVNLADYTVWRNNLGAPEGTLDNDPNSGAIGTLQYDIWKANFGQSLSPLSAAAAATVPEPSTLLLLGLTGTLTLVRRR